MKDAAVILTKNRILEEMKVLLQQVEARQLHFSRQNNNAVFAVAPKISRGENYLGLPYLVLDYPRLSSSSDLFFIRTMFWWGKFFSSTLHLSGAHADRYRGRIGSAWKRLADHSVGINDDPWVHHFESSNYRKVSEWSEHSFADWCADAVHLKIARAVPLDEWPVAEESLFRHWEELLDVCGLVA